MMPVKIWPNSAGGMKETINTKTRTHVPLAQGRDQRCLCASRHLQLSRRKQQLPCVVAGEQVAHSAREVPHLCELPRLRGPGRAGDLEIPRFQGAEEFTGSQKVARTRTVSACRT